MKDAILLCMYSRLKDHLIILNQLLSVYSQIQDHCKQQIQLFSLNNSLDLIHKLRHLKGLWKPISTCICEPNTVLLQASSVRLMVSMATVDGEGDELPLAQ